MPIFWYFVQQMLPGLHHLSFTVNQGAATNAMGPVNWPPIIPLPIGSLVYAGGPGRAPQQL